MRALIKRVRKVEKVKKTSQAVPIVIERIMVAAEPGASCRAFTPTNSGTIQPLMGECQGGRPQDTQKNPSYFNILLEAFGDP